jgi:integrase/recombinase XerD
MKSDLNLDKKTLKLKLIDEQILFEQIINQFISEIDVKSTSKETYKRQLKAFSCWWEEILNYKKDLTREDILAFKSYLEKKSLSPLTISSYILVVRKFFEWREGIGIGYPNPAKGIKGSKRAKGFRKDPLILSQISKVLTNIDTNNLIGKRDFALINLLIRTGLRTIEIIRTDRDDIRQESGTPVLWIQGKGRDVKDEFVVLTEDTLEPINDYFNYVKKAKIKFLKGKIPIFVSLSKRNKGKRLTTRTISRIVKERLRDVNIDSERLTAHSLRHTAITLALQAGASIQEAQALGRHSNINTTMIYAHNINRIENAPERKIEKLLKIEIKRNELENLENKK